MLFGLGIDDDGVDTIGGWILTKNIEIAEEIPLKLKIISFV